MSLDVYLTMEDEPKASPSSGIFVRIDGSMREVSREVWDELYPGREPMLLQEDPEEPTQVFSANITHNLNKMAEAAGIYMACWRPDEIPIARAKELIPLLEAGLTRLKEDPERYKAYDAPNGWGTYEHFVPWVEEYLEACKKWPEAKVSTWR